MKKQNRKLTASRLYEEILSDLEYAVSEMLDTLSAESILDRFSSEYDLVVDGLSDTLMENLAEHALGQVQNASIGKLPKHLKKQLKAVCKASAKQIEKENAEEEERYRAKARENAKANHHPRRKSKMLAGGQ